MAITESSKQQTTTPEAKPRRMVAVDDETGDGVVVLDPEEAWDFYESEAQRCPGMSADEFEIALARGDFKGRQEERGSRRVIMIRSPKP